MANGHDVLHALPFADQPPAWQWAAAGANAALYGVAAVQLLAQRHELVDCFGLQRAICEILDAIREPALDVGPFPGRRLLAEPEPPRKAVTRPGDLWQLGDHRLLWGDSTNAATIARVVGEDRAALLFTSPPYRNQRDYTCGGGMDWDALMQGVFQHLDAAMRPDGQVLVNLGLMHRDSEWISYWSGWLDWMRIRGWRRFGL